jgi:hypothetical protein
MSAVLENKPIDRVPTTKTFIEFRDFMFAPFFKKFMFSQNFMLARIERLNIPHEAGSVSSSFWLILAAERKIIRLGERLLARTVLVHE